MGKLSSLFNDEKLKSFAPIFLRYSFVLVFLYFSLSQLLDPTQWIGYVPESLTTIVSAQTLVYINGTFELIMLILLGLGIGTRFVALILGLHLIGITTSIGFNQTGVRDFGLALATLAIALNGTDKYCLENKWKKK